jgi:phage protein D/phage baseplate assembly protein gpV
MSNPSTKTNQLSIKLGGSDLARSHPALMDALLEIEVDTSLHMPDMFTIRFHDDELTWTDTGPFATGKPVEIELPNLSNGQLTRVISGEITAIEPEYNENFTVVLTVRGYARTHRLNRGTKTRAFIQMTDSDIVRQVAQEAGLQVQVQATSQVHEHLFQYNQSDLAFLHERARRNGFEIIVDDRTLYFRKPQGNRGQISMEWGRDLRSFRPRLTLAGQVNEVIVKGWNPQNKQAIVGQATNSTSSPQISVGGTGGQVATQAFSAAKQVQVSQPVNTQAEADTLAQSILDQINSGFVEAEGTAFGNATLVAGKKVALTKLGSRFSGTYLVTSALHVYSPDRGYDTIFRVEGIRPWLMSDLLNESTASTSLWSGVVPALVTNNNDPKNMGRVKVKFPWLDAALESNWARISTIGAGNNRGFFWLPEVNDEVLVAFEHGDFNHPYIIGSVWNGQDAPPEQASQAVAAGKVKRRTIKSRLGHTIRMVDDDSEKYIEIVDSAQGTNIKLDAQTNKLTITCKSDIKNTAQGKIELVAQTNIDLTATGNITIKGTGNVNVEATGMLTLKGSVVNIN